MTIIYPSPVFGPVHSRRLGVSLGINLMPDDGKVCTFDCIYCECGLNADHRPAHRIPKRNDVRDALEARLKEMVTENIIPDVLTFAGNGEPTSHPDFDGIIDDTLQLRNFYCPNAKVSVLSNATNLDNDRVFEALCKVDNNIQKLDTVDAGYINLLDRPLSINYDVHSVIDRLKQFHGHVVIQTMFLEGTDFNGRDVANTGDEYVLPWLGVLSEIVPEKVMIYTIDRETPCPTLRKAPKERLDAIAAKVREKHIDCTVSY